MWSPTHIQVTVQRAKNLLTKGKNGTNNCFVTIGLGKEKYQTSVKEKAEANVSWNEECELKIPDQGNRAELVLTCLHRNNLAIDEFLGQVTLPLNEMDAYNRPRSTWFKLESKPGKEKKNKERGELEVRITFIVKSGSLTDLSKKDKHKSSIGQLASSVGGSLLSIGTIEKRKGIKKFAKSLGSKMHLNGKKKNREGDDVSSFSGSFVSIGTPTSSNGGSRRYGQHAGEADPGVISEDEDEFVFDNLSHKSSGSSLNIRTGLHAPPTQNFVPRNPSPLLNNNIGKKGGKQLSLSNQMSNDVSEDVAVDPELEEIEQDFSIRARTLPPPSKPPRTPQFGVEPTTTSTPITTTTTAAAAVAVATSSPKADQKLDEWEKKLYGKHLESGKSDSLKRRSWELARVPLPATTANSDKNENLNKEHHEPKQKDEKIETAEILESKESEQKYTNVVNLKLAENIQKENKDDTTSSESEEEAVPEPIKTVNKTSSKIESPQKLDELKVDVLPKISPRVNHLLSPDVEKNDFNQFNASFAKFEQRNKAKIFDIDTDSKWNSQALIAQESKTQNIPQPLPRIREKEVNEAEKLKRQKEAEEAELKRKEEQRKRAEEDARLEAELRKNEQRLREEELSLQKELREQEEQKRREAKRFEEDQRILNFAKRTTSVEEESSKYMTPVQSPQERTASFKEESPKYVTPKELLQDKKEKRLSKFKYFAKRDKHDDDSSSSSPKSNERIIIGHEKSTTHAERRSEISAALAKKYEGKSREELMLIANGMENEALIQRQRVKELEDYLDNLLLRVMETHPKILQNPYSRTTSAKSFKNYIDMNDFL